MSDNNNETKENKVEDKEIKEPKKDEEDKNNKNILEEKNEIIKDKPDENNIIDIKKNVEENKINIEEENKITHGTKLEEEKDEVKDSIREMNRKKNYTHKVKNINLNIEEIDLNEKNNEQVTINTNTQLESKETKKVIKYYLYGIDRSDNFHIFDINNRQWVDKKRISELNLDEKSDTFTKDYQYEGTILYNTLEGVYILTGEKTDTLYYYNSHTNIISKICKFNSSHDNGSIMYDQDNNCLYVFGGKKITSCEYYSFNDKQIYKLPNLITDRANASFIISNNKIYGFFGFSYEKNNYAKTIEYIDYNTKEQWFELKDINLLKKDISFDVESVSTMYYKQNKDKIMIYAGIQGDDEDFVTEYYLVYDTLNNTMDKIKKWSLQQYKYIGKRWKFYSFKRSDPKGFHFAKNNRFLLLENFNADGYNEKDVIDILIDYKNNVHYILQGKEKIDVYRGNI